MFLNIYKYLISLIVALLLPLMLSAGEIDPGNSNNPEITIITQKNVKEGNSGNTPVSLTVSIDKCPDTRDIKLRFYTKDGQATTSDNDYKATNGTITFNKNSCTKTKTIKIKVNGDTKEEDNEDFYVDYSDNGTNSWNPMSSYQNYHWHNGDNETTITILNDDGVVLDAGKYLIVNGKEKDKANYNLNDTITFVIYAQNQGPNSTKIKIRDDLTDAIKFIPGSLKITNNVKNYSCTENNNKIRCSGSHKFKADTEVDITFKAKAIKEGAYDNYTYITDDKGKHENGDHVDFNINNVGNGVAIKKTVDKSKVKAGDNVNFTIKITNNTPEDRQLKIRDWFPTTQKGENHSGTTKNAFKYVSYTVLKGGFKYGVTCENKSNSYGPYIFCKNNLHKKLKPGKSYTVKITAKVLKTGKLCNRAHAYLQNDTHMSYSDVCLTSGGNAAPEINLNNKTANVGTNFTYNIENRVSDPDNDPVTIKVDNLPQGFTYNNGVISATPVNTLPGTYTVTVKATDDPSARGEKSKTTTKTFTITVQYPTLLVTDNNYSMGINETLNGNVITDDTGDGSDEGYNLKIKNYTVPANGTFTMKSNGEFSFKPDQDFKGTVTFKYTAKDGSGAEDTANVTIKVTTQYSSKFKDFELVNPLETRNIIGDYVVSGNTVECVTDKNDSFDGTCQNNRNYYNNKYIVKYIDIDNNDKTWNSSSSYFTIPNSFLKKPNGKNIVWAGLFWQGNVNNSSDFILGNRHYVNKQKRKDLDSNGNVITHNITPASGSIDITDTRANKVLVKVDSENTYHEITASRFYYDTEDYGDNGATYAAYADITNLLQSKDLNKGKHKLTVANILTNEGLEQDNGDYGGWSLVVIYKENFIEGKARNISIYNGFTAVDKTIHGSQQIKISGFKLPKEGTVQSQFSAFAGEGEYVYGAPFKDKNGTAWYDTMRLKRTTDSTGDTMPGADNVNNIFDAKLTNIQRENIADNDINNTNGIDIDTYNVSNIMTNYRDKDNNISSVYIYIASNKDYITPSMIAFSTELYAPKVCYDSDVKIGEYIDVDTQDRNFTAYNYNEPLQMKIMIKSQEADFDLLDTKLKVKFNPNNIFTYKKGDSKTSLPNTYEYYNAIDTDPVNGEIAIGNSPTTNGGTLGAKELTYSKMYYDFNKNRFSGKFDVVVDAKVSFDGVHKVEYQLSTLAPKGSIFNIDRCQSNPVYNPVYGMFNIERGNSRFNQTKVKRYSLYTQVVGVPYKVSVAAYKKGTNNDWSEKGTFNGTVELELIDASTFDNNSSAGFDSICNDPDTYNIGKFVNFNNQSRVKVKVPDDFPKINNQTTYPENIALKNAAFRVWVLTKKDANNTKVIVHHHCKSQSDSACFDKVYKDNYSSSSNGVCSNECKASTGTTCYECLRKNFATPICSRDNFAIRPVSYDIALRDDNETHSTTTSKLLGNNSSTSNINLAAGYLYHLDINATKYVNSAQEQKVAYGYYLNALGDENSKKSLAIFNDSSSCLDKNNTDIYTYMLNGRTIGYDSNLSKPQNGLIINNSGRYRFHLEDLEWTMVDHKGYKYKPFKNHADCEAGSTNIYNGSWNAVRGCDIESNDTINGYNDLNLNVHPYKFNVNNISAVSNPNSSSSYIYINNLDDTNSSITNGSVMGLKIVGDISAVGKNGNILTNYTNSCSANNLNIKIDYKTLKNGVDSNITDISGNPVNFKYSIYNSNVDTPSSLSINSTSNNYLNITFNKKYFVDSNLTAGKAKFVGYFNFNRTYNNPVNPFKLHLGDFKANSILDSSSVDLINNHIPKGFNKLDTNKTVYYAKAKPQSDFYDDITGNSVKTPMMIALFCNEKLDICSNYGIDTNNAITNEYDWWTNTLHNATNGEGDILINSDDTSKATINITDINSFTKGINKNLTVSAVSGVPRPFTVHIIPTQTMKDKYPYLLFNQSQDVAPTSLEGVTFVNPTSAWSGEGQTGNAIDVNQSSGRKTNKVDW